MGMSCSPSRTSFTGLGVGFSAIGSSLAPRTFLRGSRCGNCRTLMAAEASPVDAAGWKMVQTSYMPGTQSPSAWLLMAAGSDRQHGGNSGYDDQADVYYSWDSTVANAANVRAGDPVAIWDKRRLIGISVVEDIESHADEKTLYSCPDVSCGRSSIKPRKKKVPRFRCNDCRLEFDRPAARVVSVTAYQSRHDAAWTSLDGLIVGSELRELCVSPKSQLSMRALDWSAFSSEATARGAGRAIERVVRRAPDLARERSHGIAVEFPQGHAEAVVRVRRGQRAFRENLLTSFGEVCAFTGTAPARALEAGHLYSYASLGEHHNHGGLLLRRDVHRLFDDGSLAVNPSTLKVDVSDELAPYSQYASLHDRALKVDLKKGHVDWLDRHWAEHRSASAC
jgi:hypothetical protein